MNPNSYDSDNEVKLFSRGQDNFLVHGTSSRPEGVEGDDEEFKMEGEPSSLAYDHASS